MNTETKKIRPLTKFFIRVLKFLNQPGRLFFAKGSYDIDKVVDSFSPEYILLVQEKVRSELINFPNKFSKNPILFIILLPIIIIFLFVLLARLFVTNQIVLSMLNSGRIKELIIKSLDDEKDLST